MTMINRTTLSFAILFVIAVLTLLMTHQSNAQKVVPDGWTCAPELYGAGDLVCNCLCGVPDPDCFVNITLSDNSTMLTTQNITTVGCPCSHMTCNGAALCTGVCNKKDYDRLLARTDFIEILSIINTILITILLITVVTLVAIRLFEDQVAANKYKDPTVIEEGIMDDVAHFLNNILSFGGRCHKIPAIPTRRDRVARYEAKLLLEESNGPRP